MYDTPPLLVPRKPETNESKNLGPSRTIKMHTGASGCQNRQKTYVETGRSLSQVHQADASTT